MRKSRKAQPSITDSTNLLETIKAEIAEGADLLRGHYPDADEEELRDRATSMLRDYYAKGRWPTDQEIKAKKAKQAAKTSADVIDWEAVYARRDRH